MDYVMYIPIVSAVVEVIKRMKVIPHRYLSLLSIVFGFIFIFFFTSGLVGQRVLEGILVGLASAGFYDVVKEPIKTTFKLIK